LDKNDGSSPKKSGGNDKKKSGGKDKKKSVNKSKKAPTASNEGGTYQGCQLVYFQTKNPNLGKFWECPRL
jgi:hypothetical protein